MTLQPAGPAHRAAGRWLALAAAAVLAAAGGCGGGAGGAGPSADPPPAPPTSPAPETGVGPDTIEDYPAVGATLAAPQPVTVTVPETADLPTRLAREAGTDALVTLDFGQLTGDPAPDFFLLAFVNTPDADADTPASAPGFIGSAAFYLDDRPDGGPVRFVLPAGAAITRVGDPGPVTVTVVPVAHPDRPLTPQTLDLTVSIALVAAGPG